MDALKQLPIEQFSTALEDEITPHALLGQVINTIPTGLFTVDAQGTITSWNEAIAEMTGYSAEDVIGKQCCVLEGDACFRGPCGVNGERCALFETNLIRGKRCNLRRKDGSAVAVLKNARVIRNQQGKVLGAIESVADVTVLNQLEQEVVRLRERVSASGHFFGIIGRHEKMRMLYDQIDLAAKSFSAVLVLGETGTGKELVAQAIHQRSERRKGPFVRVSCAALSESLLESELFGHVRGAFTGAVKDRAGRFEAANHGTLFLDEIGDVSAAIQMKLLRVLQEREFERVGNSRPIKVDIKVVAATNQNLSKLVNEGRFRSDLYYRLAAFPVSIPPLRERRSDIPLLVDHFLQRDAQVRECSFRGVTRKALNQLVQHDWPGNVRELEHAIEYAAVASLGNPVGSEHLPASVSAIDAAPENMPEPTDLRRRPELNATTIRRALDDANGNRTRAAAALGVSRVTLWKRLKQLSL